MEQFNNIVLDVKGMFKGWNVRASQINNEDKTVGSFRITIKDMAVAEDVLTMQYTHGVITAYFNNKPITNIYRTLREYKAQCLCNSKSILVS